MLRKTFLAAVAATALSSPAGAFGLKSHLWIADQVYQDLAENGGDCRVTVRGQEFDVPRERCEHILANRNEFLTGALGPDAFPDLLIGQSIVHPGAGEKKQANYWLNKLLTAAAQPDEVAFSYGYAMHYAGDIFAHTYVNNYAGGAFDLRKDGRRAELRHFRLEKYIDQFLSYEFDTQQLKVPGAFLARMLVDYDYRQFRHPAVAHMGTIQTARDLAAYARDVKAPKLLEDSIKRMDERLTYLGELEDRFKIPRSEGRKFDRRAYRGKLSPGKIEALRAAHSAYEEAADRWKRDRALVEFSKGWAADIDALGELYIGASLKFAERMVQEGGGEAKPYADTTSMTEPYRRWAACYAPVLRGHPLSVGKAACEILETMPASIDFGDAAVRSAAGWKVRSFYLTVLEVERYLQEAMGRALVKMVSLADRNASRLIREIVEPARIDHVALNQPFADAKRGELTFVCVADWIDWDMRIRRAAPAGDRDCDEATTDSAMNPMEFKPLEYAVVLAKLSLLDRDGVRQVATRFGGEADQIRLSGDDLPEGHQDRLAHYSLLVDTVKSLDGNHQWQSKSMPFPRADPYAGAPKHYASAGYGAGEDHPGFPFYQTEGLRKGPFAALFPRPFEGHILERREMKPPHYPFRPCAGDPLRPAEGTVYVCNEG